MRSASVYLLLFSIAAAAAAGAEQKNEKTPPKVETAVLAGKIVPVESEVVNDGVLLLGGGKIIKFGPRDKIKIPRGVKVIDARSHWLFPGIVEAHTHIGLAGGLNDMVYPLNPDLEVANSIDPECPMAKRALQEGITTINTMPGSGTNHAGYSVIIKLAGDSVDDRIVRNPGCMKIAQAFNPERAGDDMGGTRMGMAHMLREHLREGKAYTEAWRAYEAGKRKEKPPFRRDLERVRLVFEGKIPVINHTYTGWGVAEAIRLFHDEFGLHTIATHTAFAGYEAGRMAALRPSKVFVNIGPRLVEYRRAPDGKVHNMATEYRKRGVKNLSINTDAFAVFYSMLSPQQHLFFQAAMSSHYGLEEEIAIRAITIEPARALMIQDRVGSLKPGKDADLLLKRRSILDVTAPVDMVLVNGEIVFTRGNVSIPVVTLPETAEKKKQPPEKPEEKKQKKVMKAKICSPVQQNGSFTKE